MSLVRGRDGALHYLWSRSLTGARESVRTRVERLRNKLWQIGQCAVAAGLAWLLAERVLGHANPFFAPIAAIICLGTSYGQRLSRVLEVTLGVALGVLFGDLAVMWIGSGWWQATILVAIAMAGGVFISSAQLVVIQAAVQGIVVSALLPDPGMGFTRWTDAVVGGAVALVAATLVPGAPLRRPREQAAKVLQKIADLLRASAEVMVTAELTEALEVLADARATDSMIRELAAAADEGLDVIASSPFRRGHAADMRRLVELSEPLDRALRNTRVLARHTTVATYRGREFPPAYAELTIELAAAVESVAAPLAANEMPLSARPVLLAVAQRSASMPRTDELPVEVVLATIRAILADLLMITGLGQLESTDALPPMQWSAATGETE